MEAESRSRTELALPTPQEPASASEIELAEISLQESVLLERPVPTAPRQTWLTVLKRELEFLGVTQILIGLIYLYFGIIVSAKINDSEFTEKFFSSFKAGYPFWGALFFAISGISSIMSEKKPSAYLIRGCLGANAVSGVAAGTGVGILISNLKQSATYVYSCEEVFVNDYCSLACFSTEVVAMILFLTILGFGSAVSLIAYGIGEILEGNQIPEDRLYEEVNIYAPIYSELEEREEPTSPADS
ncbi:high affinity immunoglobulin epsilon receptor subunit beta [Bos taurus]|uniref:Membrane spanning 4-domains A2 n=3 Tax=Bos TaxID=9903 RepID=A0ABI0NMQ1_BOVIN|nr:high affinity immunoglobulin epsilon receptor subunit beta [Bos taurus]XP_019831345.1 PREDICTED: high affinity immunoglobulin epsilon receptor subunit beta [Bos indicus]